MRMRSGTGFALAIAVLGLCSLGCFGAGDAIKDKVSETVAEKVTEKAIEATTGAAQVDLSADGGTVDLSALPAWLKYPGAKGVARFSTPAEGGSSGGDMWMLQTTDPLPTVKGWYQLALSTWKQQTMAESADGFMILAQSPAGDASVTLTISAEQGGPTSITLIHSAGAPQ